MSFLDDAISTIGQGLAQTAINEASDATGMNVGGALSALFGGSPPQTNGGDNLNNLINTFANDWPSGEPGLSVISDSLNKQMAMLQDISSQIAAIGREISQISGEIDRIDQLLAQIQQEELYETWADADDDLQDSRAKLAGAHATYSTYLANPQGNRSKEVERWATEILNATTGLMIDLRKISLFLVGAGQGKSLLELWSNMVCPLVAGGALDYRDAVAQYTDYYRKLAFAQLQGINVVVEAHNLLHPESGQAKADWEAYRAMILDQEEVFITWLIPLIYSGMATTDTFTAAHAALQLDPTVQSLNNPYDREAAYYEPSELLAEAENLLAKLYVTDPRDRRIVIHMTFISSEPIGSTLKAAMLTLNGPGGDVYRPTRSSILGGPYDYPSSAATMVDMNFAMNPGFYVGRYVFCTDGSDARLVDGSYRLTNLDDRYPPLNVYYADETPMMNPTLPNYELRASSANAFDYMNFMAYSAPRSGPENYT